MINYLFKKIHSMNVFNSKKTNYMAPKKNKLVECEHEKHSPGNPPLQCAGGAQEMQITLKPFVSSRNGADKRRSAHMHCPQTNLCMNSFTSLYYKYGIDLRENEGK